MRKIYSFMVAAVALFSAASCNKEFTNDQENLPAGEVVTFEASVDGADTKAHLDGKVSKWEATDKITIHNGTTGFEFATSEADVTNEGVTAKFTYVGDNFSGDKFMAVYPAEYTVDDIKYTWTADVEAKTVNAYIPTYQQAQVGTYQHDAAIAVAYTDNNTLAFKNATTLLKFTVEEDNITHVIFHGNDSEAITGNVKVTLGKDGVNSVECLDTDFKTAEGENIKVETKKGTWVECYAYHDENNKYFVKDKPYYIAVAPQTFEKGVTVKVKIDNGEEKFAKVTSNQIKLGSSQIINLGPVKYDSNIVNVFDYGLVGSFQGWDVANPIEMKYASNGWIVAEDVELYKDDEFKFVKDKSWDVSYGTSVVTVLEEGKEIAVVTSASQNMKVAKNGKYNLYLNPNAKKVKVECVEEYTDLMVNITIDNKADWSPLTITLWNGNDEIVSKAKVTNNKYAISGDYIGSSLTCQLFSDSKQSEKMSVSITKDGATVTLEETIIKLKVQLNTTNAKQWWGSTMKIHVWDTGTSLDTSWPGTTMTAEGNYTWSIIVPSELVGKTINFLVHNGNGWQSKDSKVTISANGNTVTGSSIGIN